jgi:hypothetical protein
MNIKKQHHATSSTFDNFDVKYSDDSLGIHFGSINQALELSKKFLEEERGTILIYEAELLFKNTLRLEDFGVWKGFQLVLKINELTGSNLNTDLDSHQIRRKLIKMGYDSIVYENDFEGGLDSYISLKPKEQIKVTDIRDIKTSHIKEYKKGEVTENNAMGKSQKFAIK